MGRKLDKLIISFFVIASVICYSQNNGVEKPVYQNYKNDSSFKNFEKIRFKVAYAQINLLKTNGALFVRLKTNTNTIQRLRNAGNIDLATQVERETQLTNKAIIRAYNKEFTFCPVYFFNSDYSDSVKHKHLTGIFVDSTLSINSSIRCSASFYLIAEKGSVYESSLGIVSENKALTATEKGTVSKEVAIVIKNRYFIQLHNPFPFYEKGYSIENYHKYVKKLNNDLESFYIKNKEYIIPAEIKEFVY